VLWAAGLVSSLLCITHIYSDLFAVARPAVCPQPDVFGGDTFFSQPAPEGVNSWFVTAAPYLDGFDGERVFPAELNTYTDIASGISFPVPCFDRKLKPSPFQFWWLRALPPATRHSHTFFFGSF
jgi:hypothetical protein